MFDLKNKVAIVTGAASGIGLAYVKELLRNNLKGVAMLDVNELTGESALKEITKEFGKERVIFLKTDVSDKQQIDDAFQKTVDTFKQLDILVNAAGIIQEIQWEKCIAVNLMGSMFSSMLAITKYFPKYKTVSEGVILNTSSIAGIFSCDNLPAYAASKSGLVGFTKAITSKYSEINQVRMIVVCPSKTETAILNCTENQILEPFLTDLMEVAASVSSQMPEDVAKISVDLIKRADTGTIWIIINGICQEYKPPNPFY